MKTSKECMHCLKTFEKDMPIEVDEVLRLYIEEFDPLSFKKREK
jgi:hypothetical protein